MFRRPGSHIAIPSAAILGFALSTFVASSAAPSASPIGTWLTESGRGVVEIAECGDALCGRIVGIDREPGSPMPTDVNGRPQCGLTIFSNEKPEADGTWLGQVTDPTRRGHISGETLGGWQRQSAPSGLHRHPATGFDAGLAPLRRAPDRRMRSGVTPYKHGEPL
jgi:Uncharacterized protein conserved in bacteria (DUF2147)